MKRFNIIINILLVFLTVNVIVSYLIYFNNLAYMVPEVSEKKQTLYNINCISKDNDGNIYIGDKYTRSIQKFDSKGNYKLTIHLTIIIPYKDSFYFNIDSNNNLTIYHFFESTNFNRLDISSVSCDCLKTNTGIYCEDTISDKELIYEYKSKEITSDIDYKRSLSTVYINEVQVSTVLFPIPYQILMYILIGVVVLKIFIKLIIKLKKPIKILNNPQ